MRRGWMYIAMAVLVGALSIVTFTVDSPRAGADELLGYDMSADARGVGIFTIIADQIPVQLPVQPPVPLPLGSQIQPEMNIPQSSSTQQSGSGYALSSAAWPGSGVANGGAVIGFVVPGFPPEVAAFLLYPVRAEARTGQDPPTTTYDIPGLSMRSRADGSSADSDAGAQGTNVLPGTFGTAHTTSSTRVVNDVATATARSVVENLDFAGVLKIDQVVSTATAKSDGTKGSGSATTRITGATVMGQGVTIDEKGLHFADTNQPVDAIVQQVAKQALTAAGIAVTVGPTTKEIDGSGAVVGANSVVITLTQSGYTLGFTLGGARAASNASTGGDNSFFDDTGGSVGGGTDVLGGGESFTGGFGDLGTGSDLGGGQAISPRPPVELTPTVAAAAGRPLSKAAMILGVLAALLFAVGMRRLNTAVLADPTAAIACTLPGEDP